MISTFQILLALQYLDLILQQEKKEINYVKNMKNIMKIVII